MTTETTEMKTSDPSVGATTDHPLTWHQINWRHAERTVRRLQIRIAQATQAGKWGKVKALQRLLTRSFSGKALAIRRVTENTGKRTQSRGWGNLEDAGTEDDSPPRFAPARISAPTTQANIYSKEQWRSAALIDSYHA